MQRLGVPGVDQHRPQGPHGVEDPAVRQREGQRLARRGLVAGAERLRLARRRRDDRGAAGRVAAGQLAQQRRRHERQVDGDDQDRAAARRVQRVHDAGERVTGLVGLAPHRHAGRQGRQRRRALGDHDGLPHHRAQRPQRPRQERLAAQRRQRLRAAQPRPGAAREDDAQRRPAAS